MKILWISFLRSLTLPLLRELSTQQEIAIIVPSDKNEYQKENGIIFFYVKIDRDEVFCSMNNNIFQKYNTIIKSYNPDIIHVHGTERNLGQIQNFTNIPVIISIQGILSGCIPFDTGNIREQEISPYRTIKNYLGRGGYLDMHKMLVHGSATYEKNIIMKGRYFFCRTNWDKAWITFMQPKAEIFHGEELLRPEFYSNRFSWNPKKCIRHRVFMPAGFNPIKGLHIAIKAAILLRELFPDVQLVVPDIPKHILNYSGIKSKIFGEEFINYVSSLIKKNHFESNIILLDRLNGEEMVDEMKKANVFLSPSTIDNSPNAIGEANMIGLPVVCSPVGGIPSFMKDEDSCLFAPMGDEYITAYQIMRIFNDDDLAVRLSESAYNTATKRHNKREVCQQYLESYKKIIAINNIEK